MNNSTKIYSDDIEMGNNNMVVEGPKLGRSLSIIAKGQIKIESLTVDSPILLNLSPNRADRELIIDVLRSMDANKDGVIDYEELVQILVSLCGQLREKEHAEFEKKLAQNTAKSQTNIIIGLSICLLLTTASTVASSFASAFIAKDTAVSSEGNNLLNRRNGQTISTSASEFHYDLFGTDEEEDLDTASEEDTTAGKIKKLGCIGGLQNQIEALAKGSLSQPVILNDSKGELHKIDGHDLKFSEDGGVVIVESSGRIIQIKKDEACAASAERRRLQDHLGYQTVEAWDENASYGVLVTYCNTEWTEINSDHFYGFSSETVPDGSMEIICHGEFGMNWASQNP